jgi:drug/metabolite transporter (DMT)-like permease
MTWLLVALVVGSTAIGEVAITRGMKQTGEIDDFRPGAWLSSLGRAFLNPWLMLGVGGMTVAFFSFLILVSHEDLSFSVPATASTVVAQTLGARFILRERVGAARWGGTLLVAAGVLLLRAA